MTDLLTNIQNLVKSVADMRLTIENDSAVLEARSFWQKYGHTSWIKKLKRWSKNECGGA